MELRHDSKELRKVSRLLREHRQQLNSAEQKLAEKEDTIHGLRGQLEHSQVSVQQVSLFLRHICLKSYDRESPHTCISLRHISYFFIFLLSLQP